MGKIINNPDKDRRRLVVQLHPSELLYKTFNVASAGSVQILDAIKSIAWRELHLHGSPNLLRDKFVFSSVEFSDGEYEISFYREVPEIRKAPGDP